MNINDRRNVSSSTLLFLRYGLPIKDSLPIIENWLLQHPQESDANLSQLIQSGNITVKHNKLLEIPQLSFQQGLDLASEIQNSKKLSIKSRWYRLKCYQKCFIGSELVDWLINYKNLNQEEAVALGKSLLSHKLIQQVCNDRDFKNDFSFYRFT